MLNQTSASLDNTRSMKLLLLKLNLYKKRKMGFKRGGKLYSSLQNIYKVFSLNQAYLQAAALERRVENFLCQKQ